MSDQLDSRSTKREMLSLDGKWPFAIDREEDGKERRRRLDEAHAVPFYISLDREETGEERGYPLPGYDDSRWLSIPVPGDWDSAVPELWGYGGIGWYRRHFHVPPAWHERSIHLRFDGANYLTTLWLNGSLIGTHEGGYDPFEFDVSGQMIWDAENVLVARVDNWPQVNRVPTNFTRGWHNYGGIYRSVTLLALPALRITDVFVHPEAAVDGGALTLDVTIKNEGSQTEEVTPVVDIAFAGKRSRLQLVEDITVALEPGSQQTVKLSGILPDPHLWSPATPHLYRAIVRLRQQRQIVDRLAVTFGVRKFEVSGTKLRLNNRDIYLTGFDRHEEYAGSGRVDRHNVLVEDMAWIQRLKGNTVRMHYQGHPRFYELADRMGLLVFAEIPLWQIGHSDPAEWQNAGVWSTSESMLRTMIATLKNHPSVVIWSVGNENTTCLEQSRPLIGHLTQVAHSLDASRPVALVGMFGPRECAFDLVDIPCINPYLKHDRAGLRECIEKTHALTPDKPLLITEFGAEAIRGMHGDYIGAEEDQCQIIEDHWAVFQEYREYIPGAIIWSLADYFVNPKAPDHSWSICRNFLSFGMLSIDRRPKASAELARRIYSSVEQ